MHAAARNSDRSIGELIGWVIAWYVAIGIFGFPLNLGLLELLLLRSLIRLSRAEQDALGDPLERHLEGVGQIAGREAERGNARGRAWIADQRPIGPRPVGRGRGARRVAE